MLWAYITLYNIYGSFLRTVHVSKFLLPASAGLPAHHPKHLGPAPSSFLVSRPNFELRFQITSSLQSTQHICRLTGIFCIDSDLRSQIMVKEGKSRGVVFVGKPSYYYVQIDYVHHYQIVQESNDT
ncbi:hypothetical protein HanRHA438_Chr02g0060071 [Helianthus annuus]|nr:hypothetical protein HanRHA438_Chr02g0060071 [Helianthus annuus]